MVVPKHRKVLLKRVLDSTVYRGVVRGAALLVAASGVEAREYRAAGIPEHRIVVRPHGFPEPLGDGEPEALRTRIGVDRETPIVLYAGRIAHGKGLELIPTPRARHSGRSYGTSAKTRAIMRAL